MLRKNGEIYYGEYLDLKILVRKSGHEEVYCCPFCTEITGTDDKKGKFYFNNMRGVGHCFRCEAVIISNALRTPELIRQQLDTVSDEDKYKYQKLAINNWTSPISENPECSVYMTHNREIRQGTLDRFKILATRTPKLGVVFCNKQWRDGSAKVTDFLSIRNIDSSIRHTNIRDQVKPLMWCNYVDTDRVILVEGAISGLAAYQHLNEQVCPLVLSGKTISSFQLSQLKQIVSSKRVEHVYVATDGGFFESGIKVARLVYKALDHQGVSVLKLPWGKDPNSLTTRQFRELWETQCHEFQPLATNILRRNAYK